MHGEKEEGRRRRVRKRCRRERKERQEKGRNEEDREKEEINTARTQVKKGMKTSWRKVSKQGEKHESTSQSPNSRGNEVELKEE